MLLGAGRNTVADRIDPAVGIELGRKVGDAIAKGDLLATLHYNDQGRLETGADADLVLWDGDLTAARTWVKGNSVYEKQVQ